MCRITGFWDFNYHGRYDLTGVITAMRDTMTHGGPDDAGDFVLPEKGLALGHRRLSIIDLSRLGHQPMSSSDGRFTITYNGEVYNYKDIRAELEEKGCRFVSNSDTEVILHAYGEWGMDCLSRFRGMWAFAMWDAQEQRLMLCRDRVGVKPLYWYSQDRVLLFSSELKAFHQHPGFVKELDKTSLSDFFKYGYIPAPHSIFKNVRKLEAGHLLTIDRQLSITDIKYWDAYDQYQRGLAPQREGFWDGRSDDDIQSELERTLRESFKLRMVADVPVGVFLSGGIDSSLVTALLADEGFKLKTFTIGFKESAYDEARFARQVAQHLGTDHTELYCTEKDAFDIIPRLPEIYDEPFGDSSSIPTYLVSRLAREQVKVSVSADGGDELFCGYTWYGKLEKVLSLLHNPLTRRIIRTISGIADRGTAGRLYDLFNFALPQVASFKDQYFKLRDSARVADFKSQYLALLSQVPGDDLGRLGLDIGHELSFKTDDLNMLQSMMLTDLQMFLVDDILVKLDRATMGVSLEGREPFLDHKLIEYAVALPTQYKFKDGISKKILRDILYRYVPRQLIERPKQGFAIPIESWLQSGLAPLFHQYVEPERIRKEGILESNIIRQWKSDFIEGKIKINTKLWYLFIFEMWAERWLK